MMKKVVKLVLGFFLALLFIFLVLLVLDSGAYKNPIVVLGDVDDSEVTGDSNGMAIIEEAGWSKPIKLPASDVGREDSTYITRDGRYVLFYYDSLVGTFRESKQPTNGTFPEVAKVYITKRPFVEKEVHPMSVDNVVNVQAGPYISEAQDLYYTQTFIEVEPEPHVAMPRKTVVNGDRIIDLGTGEEEGDPHYCDQRDELYVNIIYDSGEQDIVVFKDNKTTYLPEPINAPGRSDFQPFLTDDCKTMFFTSTRAGNGSQFPLQVYRSQRLDSFGEFSWSEPELFISFPQSENLLGGVGEFSMTRDGKQMVFLELRVHVQGENITAHTDMYYARKIA